MRVNQIRKIPAGTTVGVADKIPANLVLESLLDQD